MACYTPLRGYRGSDGKVRLGVALPGQSQSTVACGTCIGCKVERSRQWAVRSIHEAQMHRANCFVTLTYADEHLPKYGTLNKRDIQLFFKRIRKSGHVLRYLQCGEYGDRTFRPHHHACLFGVDFTCDPKAKLLKTTPDGHDLYTSPVLEAAWKLGQVSVSKFSYETARYVAQYITKKSGKQWDYCELGGAVDDKGKPIPLKPPFATMSRNPGLGKSWIETYYSDVYPHDEVIIAGSRQKPPKYYDLFAEKKDPAMMAELKAQRVIRAEADSDNSPARLAQRKTYQELKLKTSRTGTH